MLARPIVARPVVARPTLGHCIGGHCGVAAPVSVPRRTPPNRLAAKVGGIMPQPGTGRNTKSDTGNISESPQAPSPNRTVGSIAASQPRQSPTPNAIIPAPAGTYGARPYTPVIPACAGI